MLANQYKMSITFTLRSRYLKNSLRPIFDQEPWTAASKTQDLLYVCSIPKFVTLWYQSVTLSGTFTYFLVEGNLQKVDKWN